MEGAWRKGFQGNAQLSLNHLSQHINDNIVGFLFSAEIIFRRISFSDCCSSYK